MPAAVPRIIKAREMMMRYYPSAVLASLVAIFVVVTCNQGTSCNLKLSFDIIIRQQWSTVVDLLLLSLSAADRANIEIEEFLVIIFP